MTTLKPTFSKIILISCLFAGTASATPISQIFLGLVSSASFGLTTPVIDLASPTFPTPDVAPTQEIEMELDLSIHEPETELLAQGKYSPQQRAYACAAYYAALRMKNYALARQMGKICFGG